MQKAPDPWRGRDDSAEQGDTRRLFQIVERQAAHYPPGCPVLIGFACDAGVIRNQGRPGARSGPQAIRRMLAGLPAHDMSLLQDAGDVSCEGDALEAAQAAFGRKVCEILDAGARPVTLGGGHEIAWASFQGLYRHLNGPACGLAAITEADRAVARPLLSEAGQDASGRAGSILIVNLDAHFDLRTSRPGNSGTPFDQILAHCRQHGQAVHYAVFGISRLANTAGLFQHARDLGVTCVEDIAMQERHLEARLADLDALIGQADHIHLTIDLDCLPASVAPGVSAPAAFGMPLTVVEAFIRHIKASGKLRLADLAEMNPEHDIDGHTARIAARLAWLLLAP